MSTTGLIRIAERSGISTSNIIFTRFLM